jgi:NADH-quinone oxidoreductase subunit C/D
MKEEINILDELAGRFGPQAILPQATRDDVPTAYVPAGQVRQVLRHLKSELPQPYNLLYDLTAIDERLRTCRAGLPEGDFTVVYYLMSLERNKDIRLKVALSESKLALASITDIWPMAEWYEREVFDMFGIVFEGHPRLRRILNPPWWQGHPLRKDYPARATEIGPFELPDARQEAQIEALQFKPEDWGMVRRGPDAQFMFLNLGPHHPGTHGVLRMILQLDGQEIVGAVADIGYHHRGAEKMGERQSWHTYIPYTDRVDYLSGVLNNLPYLLAVEKLAGIELPPRAKVIRVMLCELFRIISHLVWYGTFAQDLGQMSPVFYLFNDREKAFEIVEAVTGARMHPSWFRIGGVAADLPVGWERLIGDFLEYLPRRLDEYDRMVLANSIFKARTVGIGALSTAEALEWGITGANLRATGLEFDLRKKRPYAGYDQFEFDIPTGRRGDCYDRALVRVEEMRQSLRIIRQCLDNMPPGDYKSRHPLTTPPIKERTMHDIETLITHFLGVSWGPVIPPGEAHVPTEGAKGMYSYYLVSDGNTASYRTRIRTPSFPHIQAVQHMTRGYMIPDLVSILGSIDFVLGDVDR